MTSTDPNQAAYAASKNDAAIVSSTCPLMNKNVQLLPLRYGLTEHIDPSTELRMPFKLESRPLGIRLVRDGYLYLLNNNTGNLYEYELKDAVVGKMVYKGAEVAKNKRIEEVDVPNLIFPKTSTLYVNYSELQWTDRKCMQVLLNHKDRQYFMQEMSLAKADPLKGGIHLLTPEQAENWLAELQSNDANNERQEKSAANKGGFHAEEQEAYIWEKPSADQSGSAPRNSSQFRHIQIGKLTGQILPDYEHDALFLVLRDDIGVMRDLAQYQDHVVDWISEWRQGGANLEDNERDYMIACYIESLTQIQAEDLTKLNDNNAQAMLDDLAKLPEPDQSNVRRVIVDYLNNSSKVNPLDPTLPSELKKRVSEIRKKMAGVRSREGVEEVLDEINTEIDRYYLIKNLTPANAGKDFIDAHTDTILRLKKEHNRRVKDILTGAKLGQRGINDLIDRPAMDDFLATERLKLERWNALLEQITSDRTQMTIENRFHRAAWYYDAQQAEQVGVAFATQYACLKDICRSDTANEALLDWLEKHPEYDRPLFHTLDLNTQEELRVQYAQINASVYAIASNLTSWQKKLTAIEQGKLPSIDDLSGNTKILGQSAQGTLNPALSFGISRAMEAFFNELGQQKVPDLDQLFRKLPKILSTRLLDAAKQEGLTFTVANEAEKLQLQQDIKETADHRSMRRKLQKKRSNLHHKSPEARKLLGEIKSINAQLDILEPKLAAALSPIGELPDNSIRIAGATQGRAAITLILPPAQQQQVAGLMSNLRNGYGATGDFSKLGDGVGLAVAVAQLANLYMVLREIIAQPEGKKDYMKLAATVSATGAAGFSVAQGIAASALKTRAAQLITSLNENGLKAVHIQMGKLHFTLGGLSYLAGFLASVFSSFSHYGNWTDATRSGNAQAQQGAAVALTGSSLMTANNVYGLAHTMQVGGSVVKSLLKKEAASAAWAVAGPRLATVFFRFNIAGALFTALELGGTWWYNRNNTDAHDDWLLSTPWSSDAEKRQNHSLDYFQQRLLGVINEPQITVTHEGHNNWLKDYFLSPSSINIALELPSLSRTALKQPLAGRPSARLSLNAYSIRTIRYGKGSKVVQWSPITAQIINELHQLSAEPLKLRIQPSPLKQSIGGQTSEELLLEIRTEQLDTEGQYQLEHHTIRFALNAEGQHKPTAQTAQTAQGTIAVWEQIDPQLLPEVPHAEN